MPEIKNFKVGLCHLFLKHTSASLILNEVYDREVLDDMEGALNRLAPEDNSLYKHTLEGSDDMPAHIKCAMLGVSPTIPIGDGKLLFGTWQGLWLCEHRDEARARNIVVTIQGQEY